jgi:catechol 2,3-dioxygenase-like lactoylglutathione lyase family enzyme
MITKLGIVTVWVLDQDSAKDFFVNKLGFELRDDIKLGDGAIRWVTVGPKGQSDVRLTLMVPGPPTHDPESGEQLKALISKGVMGAGAFNTDDCHATYRELAGRGVTFIQEPQDRPYGVEAIFRDDSGNWYSLTQPRAELDLTKPWS